MWLYRTGGDAEHPIVLYEYQQNRKAENAEAFLKALRAGSMRMGIPATTDCRRTSGWLAAGRICGESLTKR